MPEAAEIKLMSDFVNQSNSKVRYFETVAVNPKTKVKTDLTILKNKDFRIQAESRGKELRLTFKDMKGDIISPNGNESLHFAMGMSGNWSVMNNNEETLEAVKTSSSVKHIKISIFSQDLILVMHDMRNFAKWRWDSDWSEKRSPCPLHEFEEFRKHLFEMENHPRKKKLRTKPLNEILMDQSLFNGLGNYLRAEIVYRLDVSPFQTFSDLSNEKKEELIQLCHDIPNLAYAAGGGEFYTFQNPNTADRESKIGNLIQVYNRRDKEEIAYIDDMSGRRFWFHGKWATNRDTEIFLKYFKELEEKQNKKRK